MAKLTTDPVGNFNSEGLATLNANFDKVEAALENTLSRDGTTPNQMEADLDMNDNDIINVDNIHASNGVFDNIVVDNLDLEEVVDEVTDLRDQTAVLRDQAEAAEVNARAAEAGAVAVANAGFVFDTVSDVQSANVPPILQFIRTAGYSSPGDGDGALYKRVETEPTHTRKIQSADGAWWEDTREPIFILATGQSNFAVTRPHSWTPPATLRQWNNVLNDVDSVGTAFEAPSGTVIGAPLAFCEHVALSNPGRPVYLLVVARSGQDISHWLPGATAPDVYAGIVANIVPALSAIGISKISTLLWWQGESGGRANSYPDDFEEVQNRFKAEDWFDEDTPVVVFGVTNSTQGGGAYYQQINLMLQLCVNARPSERFFVNTGSLTGSAYWADPLHMTALGYITVARMAANRYLGKVAGNTSPGLAVDYETGNISIGASYTEAGLVRNRNVYRNPTPASATFHGVEKDGTYATFRLDGYGGANGLGGIFIGQAAAGTAENPEPVRSFALLASLQGRGCHTAEWGAGNFGTGGEVRILAVDDWSPTSRPTQINFYTTASGAVSQAVAGSIYPNGDWHFMKNITLFPASIANPANNGEMTFQLTSDTTLAIKVRGSDGVVRTASLTLA